MSIFKKISLKEVYVNVRGNYNSTYLFSENDLNEMNNLHECGIVDIIKTKWIGEEQNPLLGNSYFITFKITEDGKKLQQFYRDL